MLPIGEHKDDDDVDDDDDDDDADVVEHMVLALELLTATVAVFV